VPPSTSLLPAIPNFQLTKSGLSVIIRIALHHPLYHKHAFASHVPSGTPPIPVYTATHTNTHAVIDAYARSLRVTFIFAIAVFVIVNILVVGIKLPRLDRKQPEEEDASTTAQDEDG